MNAHGSVSQPIRDTAHIDALFAGLGARAPHAVMLWRNWLAARPLDSGHRSPAQFFPLRLRESLPALQAALDGIVRTRSEHPAADGSMRLLLDLADGQSIETVLLPRDGVCVSTQVGCAVGCVFCMTGRSGLLRQVGSAEILAQVVLARSQRTVRKVVFMGMGEPAHNLDAVLEAIGLLGTAGGIGHKNLVFSTVGDLRVFERLPLCEVRPALALSLHSTQAALRARLLPRAPRIDPSDLVELGERYARQTGYPIQYQWTLIDGVNDGPDEAQGIARLLAGKYAVMNFIPLNAVGDDTYARPPVHRGIELVRYLRSQGVLATLRQSAGQDVDAGCGQLRARSASARTIPIAKVGLLD